MVYSGRYACEIVLEGTCPRCKDPMVSTHPVRGVRLPRAPGADDQDGALDGRTRLVMLRCCCAHDHDGRPSDLRGCGAAFAVRVRWEDAETEKVATSRWVRPRAGGAPSMLGLEQEGTLQAAKTTELADVRKAAENWRTGLGALLAILVAVLFIQGKQSLDEIDETWVKWVLGVLLLLSAVSALYGAYRAVRAAYGIPSDEFMKDEDSSLLRFIHAVKDGFRKATKRGTAFRTPDRPDRYETVGAWRHAFVQLAVNDLRQAKAATIASLVLFIVAVIVSWLA